ncbi:MAG: OmpA family protein [Syntrophorhabdaceae bacterium]|nr:OmpA family protein [Syntrophorhabdaceae bacterium]
MSNDKLNPPVRIIVKKKGHGGHHGGAWKVAYADFVTAMMALFIVLWIVGQSNPIKEAISMYFTNPNIFTGGSGILQGTKDGVTKPINTQLPNLKDALEKEIIKLQNEGKKIEEMVLANPAFEKFKDKIQISVDREGMRIELIENSEGLFFDIGSAKIKPETVKLLKMIAAELGKLPNSVIIEGYTDARPYVGQGYTNWELSADRANAARKELEENGLRKDQIIEVRGFADRNLKQPDKPFDFSNRRVNIVVTVPKHILATATGQNNSGQTKNPEPPTKAEVKN